MTTVFNKYFISSYCKSLDITSTVIIFVACGVSTTVSIVTCWLHLYASWLHPLPCLELLFGAYTGHYAQSLVSTDKDLSERSTCRRHKPSLLNYKQIFQIPITNESLFEEHLMSRQFLHFSSNFTAL